MALTGEASRPLEIPPRAGEPTADTFAVSAYDPITQRRDGQTEVVNLAVSTVVDPPPPSVTAVTSGFDNLFSDNEGWDVGPKTEGRTWNNCGPAEQHPSGGNPDGYISHEEYCGSPYIFNDSWYFVAPAKFRGDRSDAYGKSLDFDLNSDYSSSWTSMDGAELVVLTGAGKFLYVTMAGRTYPGEAWTHYSVPLVAGAGWRMSTSYLLTSTQEATATDIREVLTDLDSVRILGDFGRDGTGGLDNVVLGGN